MDIAASCRRSRDRYLSDSIAASLSEIDVHQVTNDRIFRFMPPGDVATELGNDKNAVRFHEASAWSVLGMAIAARPGFDRNGAVRTPRSRTRLLSIVNSAIGAIGNLGWWV
ncbi:hypothetical protein [Bradyrhizobium sp. JYMT SZCCT0428]|uniref:hypothetical protein n=1 Tax=Bradyrhizobium sp. JYMT SZCCT0428 TaxID=2807673 RepID=UPI001BA91544|nr:hypothetical protein [Bradyrhizobium sp. JYMT SZCCT0428]MBR1156043.1 hypothetical protein [Bradyrhizobium sp. JYMT SZCCT0428]